MRIYSRRKIIHRSWRFLSSVRICALARTYTQFSQKETAHARRPSFFSALAHTKAKFNAEHHRRVRNQGGCWRTCILLYTYILCTKNIFASLWEADAGAWRIIRRGRMFCRRANHTLHKGKTTNSGSNFHNTLAAARASTRAAPNQSFTSYHPPTSTKDNSSRGNTASFDYEKLQCSTLSSKFPS